MRTEILRRSFIVFAWLFTTAALPAAANGEARGRDALAYRAMDAAALRTGFAAPPQETGPWAYWFWWDNVLSRDEIVRELEEMSAAGFAGAEIRAVTFRGWGGPRLTPMDAKSLADLGQRKYEYLSKEWLEILAHTCATAERLNLRLAINLGQGWPPGGPWVTEEHRSKHLSWSAREVTGPEEIRIEMPVGGFVLAWKLAGSSSRQIESESFVDLAQAGRAGSDGAARLWTVPAGRWVIATFNVTPGGICDKGDGPEVDPASWAAVMHHLETMFARLDPILGRFYGQTLVDVASDSWEYERFRGAGRYWSQALPAAFQVRAGYDLRSHMYALIGYGEDAPRVTGDLERVERELVHENFFATVTRFLAARGLGHRPQVYGRGLERDLLTAYALASTPEVEQGHSLPEAPWAAHTTGQPLVSAEAYTFLSLPEKRGPVPAHELWESTPLHLRLAANRFFADGVNRIQMHCFSYSPPELPLPGWRMYAETHLNRTVPWFAFIAPLNRWISRQQWVLQAGWPVADTLVYPALASPADVHAPQHAAWNHHPPVPSANAVDGANRFTLGRIADTIAGGRYAVGNVCVIAPIREPSEARELLAILGENARLVCQHSLPAEWPALRAAGGEDLRARFDRLQAAARIVDARGRSVAQTLESLRSVRGADGKVAGISFQHRRIGDADAYLVMSPAGGFQGELSFPRADRRVEFWEADSGRIVPVGQLRTAEGRTHVRLELEPLESALVVFSPGPRSPAVTDATGGRFIYRADGRLVGRFDRSGPFTVTMEDGSSRKLRAEIPAAIAVGGPWRLSVAKKQMVSPQPEVTLDLDRLVSWRELAPLQHYAGTATYRATVNVTGELLAADLGWELDLGEVFELAEVTINGHPAGTAWRKPFRLEVTALLKPGLNDLRIEVPNVLKNHLEKGDAYQRPSGLLGPVKLVPRREVTLSRQ